MFVYELQHTLKFYCFKNIRLIIMANELTEIYSLLTNHNQEFLVIKNEAGSWQLPGGCLAINSDSILQIEVVDKINETIPKDDGDKISIHYPEYISKYEEDDVIIFHQQLMIEDYSDKINLEEETGKFVTLQEFLKESNKIHTNETINSVYKDFYKLKDSQSIIEEGWSNKTSSYHHKWNDTPNPKDVEPALKQVWVLDLQWSDCPKELEREAKYMWESWNLGNNHCYKDFTLKELKSAYSTDLPLIIKYISEQIEIRNLDIKEKDQILIHWWW